MPSSAAQTAPIASPQSVSALSIDESRWKQIENLPCIFSVEVQVPGFTLRDLLALEKKSVIQSQAATHVSPPLRVNGEVLALGDFEVLGKRLAVRLTELA